MKDKRKYSDRAKYLISAVSKRRKKIKEMAIKHKGSKCCICGYNKYNGALEFHHLDENLKSFSLGLRGHSRSWERVKEELNKCVILCSNCHKEIHAGVSQLPQEIVDEKQGELLP